MCVFQCYSSSFKSPKTKTFKASKATINSSFCDQWDENMWLSAGGLHMEEEAGESWTKTLNGFCMYLVNFLWIGCFLKQSELDHENFKKRTLCVLRQ